MKLKNIMQKGKYFSILISSFSIGLALLSSCENAEQDFDDFETQAVYFGHQYPVRTIELGEDQEVDLTLDNQRMIEIKATMSGVYSNDRKVVVNYQLDPSLVAGKTLEDGTSLEVLPSNYYTFEDQQIVIPSGKMLGGVKVKFTDAFFADPLSTTNHYVLPIRLKSIETGADTILEDRSFVAEIVKYANPWEANYTRRGVDVITVDGVASTVRRHKEYVEKDELVRLKTKSLSEVVLSLNAKDAGGTNVPYDVVVKVDDNGNCTLSSQDAAVAVSGSGKYVNKGEKNSIGGKDCNAIYLDYTVSIPSINTTYSTKDTLVMVGRGFGPTYYSFQD